MAAMEGLWSELLGGCVASKSLFFCPKLPGLGKSTTLHLCTGNLHAINLIVFSFKARQTPSIQFKVEIEPQCNLVQYSATQSHSRPFLTTF